MLHLFQVKMKVFFLLSMGISLLLGSCKRDTSTNASEEEIYLADYEAPQHKWGFMDTTGAMTIDAVYDDAGPFSEGFAAVNKDGKWGYINKAGEIVIQPIYKSAWAFHEGYARVEQFGQQGQFIDKTGIPLKGEEWSAADDFSNGFAKVSVGSVFGYINASGEIAVQPIYTRGYNFTNGLCVVEFQDKLGVINSNGTEIVKPTYDQIKLPTGSQIIICKSGDDAYVLDYLGKELFHLPAAKIVDSDGEVVSVREGDQMYLLHVSTKVKSPPFSNIIYLEEKRWAGKSDGGYQLIDNQGKAMSTYHYEQLNKFRDGVAAYSKEGLWGYINLNGNDLTGNVFGLAWDYKDGLARAAFEEGIAFINLSQKLAFYPPTGSLDMRDFSEGLAAVQVN